MRLTTIAALSLALGACGGSEGPDDFGGVGGNNRTELDRQVPSIQITNPADGATAAREPITVTGLASDDVALDRIEVQIDGGAFQLAAGLDNWSFVTSVLTDGLHSITARATDAAGKTRETTITVTVGENGGIDTEPPTVTVLEPMEGAVIGAGPLSVRGTASDNVEVASVSVGINLSGQVTARGTDLWEVDLDATLLDEGPTNLLIVARDTSGNSSPLTTLTINVDRAIPQATISGPVALLSTRRSATFNVSGSANYTYALDGGTYGDSIPTTTPLELSGLEDGLHRIDVLGLDEVGVSQETPTSFTWTVDATAPTVQVSGAPSAPTQAMSLSLVVSEAEFYRYRLDGGPYGDIIAATEPLTLNGLSEGGHLVEVKGLDPLGNEQEEPTLAAWVVDTTPPSTPILIDVPPSLTQANRVDIPVAGAGIDQYTISVNGGPESDLNAQLLITLDDFDVGEQTLTVTGYDPAGNVGPSRMVTWEVTTEPVPTLDVQPPPEVSGPEVMYEVSGIDFASYEYQVDPPSAAPSAWTAASFGPLVLDLTSFAVSLPGEWQIRFRYPAGAVTVDTFLVDVTPVGAVLTNTPPRPTNRLDIAVRVGGSEVVEYTYSLDEGPLQGPDEVSTVITEAGLIPGLHTLDVYGIDFAGNIAPSPTSIDWTINVTRPVAALTGAPASPTTQTSASLNVGGLGVAAYRYRINGGEIGDPLAVADPIVLTGLAPGIYSVEVFPEDVVGNVGDPTQAVWTVVD